MAMASSTVSEVVVDRAAESVTFRVTSAGSWARGMTASTTSPWRTPTPGMVHSQSVTLAGATAEDVDASSRHSPWFPVAE